MFASDFSWVFLQRGSIQDCSYHQVLTLNCVSKWSRKLFWRNIMDRFGLHLSVLVFLGACIIWLFPEKNWWAPCPPCKINLSQEKDQNVSEISVWERCCRCGHHFSWLVSLDKPNRYFPFKKKKQNGWELNAFQVMLLVCPAVFVQEKRDQGRIRLCGLPCEVLWLEITWSCEHHRRFGPRGFTVAEDHSTRRMNPLTFSERVEARSGLQFSDLCPPELVCASSLECHRFFLEFFYIPFSGLYFPE